MPRRTRNSKSGTSEATRDEAPRRVELPTELSDRICDFLTEDPCDALALHRFPLGNKVYACRCRSSDLSHLLSLLVVSREWFSVAARRIWRHLCFMEDRRFGSDVDLTDPILDALESPRGQQYAACVQMLAVELDETTAAFSRRLAAVVPHMTDLSVLYLDGGGDWIESKGMERLWMAARGLPLLGLVVRATPPPAILVAGLRTWTTLQSLDLPCGFHSNELAPDMGFGKALAGSAPDTLRSISISGAFPEVDLVKLLDKLIQLKSLTLGVPSWISASFAAALGRALTRGLNRLVLTSLATRAAGPPEAGPSDEVQIQLFDSLRGPELEVLVLGNFDLSDAVAARLGEAINANTRLGTLSLRNTSFTAQIISAMDPPEHLTDLLLCETSHGTLLPLLLSRLPRLARLDLTEVAVRTADLAAIGRHPTLSSLSIMCGTFRPYQVRAMLRANPRIRKVEVGGEWYEWGAFVEERAPYGQDVSWFSEEWGEEPDYSSDEEAPPEWEFSESDWE
ncbi:hypothetical protein DFJ74DRAFT_670364 [Hyaloraphidium curvatum]|nr:hypothetical protein DFJ74DRAFT_670364 [Hyaloraphidium curvatum]